MSNKNGILEYCFNNLNNYNDMPNIVCIVCRTKSLEKSYSYLNNIHSHSFLILCAINFFFGHGVYIPWGNHSHWTEILSIEIILMSLVIGGRRTFIIMLRTFIFKNNR